MINLPLGVESSSKTRLVHEQEMQDTTESVLKYAWQAGAEIRSIMFTCADRHSRDACIQNLLQPQGRTNPKSRPGRGDRVAGVARSGDRRADARQGYFL
jgi:hypothetical protein